MIFTSTVYNTKGQVESVSDPYYSNGTALLNSFLYDNYGRKTSLTRPSGRNTTWSYNNDNVVTEITAGKTYTKAYSADGTVSSATDPGGTIAYSYYPDGKIKQIIAPGSATTSMTYDLAGNQDQLVDPSAGTTKFAYNGFGELTTQISPGPKTVSINYNTDGTIYQKITSEGTTTNVYNSSKQLIFDSTPGNVNDSIWYDTYGRVIKTAKFISGSVFRTTFAYDNKGRIRTVKHPSGIEETKNYNSNGYLYSVSTNGIDRWTTQGMNARQQVISGQYWKQSGGNLNAVFGYDPYGYPSSTVVGGIQNYSYNFDDVTGNLTSRQNNIYTGLTEIFHYDNLNRLDDANKGDSMTLDMGYDGKGNITTKSDVGTLQYNITGPPYAVSGINPSTGITPTLDQTFTYTSFGSVNYISENNYNATLIYGSDNQRAQMVVKQGSNTILTRLYPTSVKLNII